MADMGFRENVLGPQPIARRKPIPQEMLQTVHRVMDLIADGKGSEMAALAAESARDQIARLASAAEPGNYSERQIIGTARTNEHYWVKARMSGPEAKPFTFQLRLGLSGGKWTIWEAMNLTAIRSAWTR
jgi:hypothetical protein